MQETTLFIDLTINPYICDISIPELNVSIVSHATKGKTDMEKTIYMLRLLANVLEK